MISAEHRALSIVILIMGIAYMSLFPLMHFFPDAWGWEPRQPEYEQMIIGVYFVLGIFAIIAAGAPMKHLSLIWFMAVSNLVHGVIMLVQALGDPEEKANLSIHGDVPALIVTGVLIAILAPKRLAAE